MSSSEQHRLAFSPARPRLRDLRLYTAADTLHEDQLVEAGPSPMAPAPPTGILESDVSENAVEFDLILHNPSSAEAVLQWLQVHNVEIEGAAGRKVRIWPARGAAGLTEPARRPEEAMLVEHSTTGQRWSGNPQRKKVFEGGDPGNNVQVIRWEDAPAGACSVQVTAVNLLPRAAGAAATPQAFALVITGDRTQTLDLV